MSIQFLNMELILSHKTILFLPTLDLKYAHKCFNLNLDAAKLCIFDKKKKARMAHIFKTGQCGLKYIPAEFRKPLKDIMNGIKNFFFAKY